MVFIVPDHKGPLLLLVSGRVNWTQHRLKRSRNFVSFALSAVAGLGPGSNIPIVFPIESAWINYFQRYPQEI